MKKIILVSFLLFVLFLVVFFSLNAIRFSNGVLLGVKKGELYLFEYDIATINRDGPYVFNKGGKRYSLNVIADDHSVIPEVIRTPVEKYVNVVVDNAKQTEFSVSLRDQYSRAELNLPSPKKIFVISDLEGRFDQMVQLLIANGVIDQSLSWTFGTNHLVLNGDMVDRGTNVLPMLWLIYKLESEAKLSGGFVSYILGNHERYLMLGATKSVAKKYFATMRATSLSQSELWSNSTELGRWLRTKPIAIKIGDNLFMHGGLSPEVIAMNPTLHSLDAEAEKNFLQGNSVQLQIDNSILHADTGVLFYRGLVREPKAEVSHVDTVLKHFSAKRIVIGHTLVDTISSDYGGKVLRTSSRRNNDSYTEALMIEGNKVWKINTLVQKTAL
ncbi:metallophosphoesterase [Pseudoalteromonas ruthenica]|uniref:metallophosphoesterase n=1 Tax=Pseudoalteromonas ruthenica TaxID=151081 RepID=UPI002016F910|nr:metallophosphoesterase [Pseudoalteromonas ruthenica]